MKEMLDITKLKKQIRVLKASNASLAQKKPLEVQNLQRKVDEQELGLEHLRDQLTEREKEVRMLKIKLKEFKYGTDSVTLSDKQFLEMEAMLAKNNSSSILQRLQFVHERLSDERGEGYLRQHMDKFISNQPGTTAQSIQLAPPGSALSSVLDNVSIAS